MGNTAKRAFGLGISALVLIAPVQAGAAIYIKFEGVDGESTDSGDAHLDYLTITMDNAAAAGDDHSSGDEHEIEYDIAAAASAGIEPDEIDARNTARSTTNREFNIGMPPTARAENHEAAHVVQQRGARPPLATDGDHKDWIIIDSMSSPIFREQASGLATGKRQHRPLSVTKELDKSTPIMAARGGGILNLPASRRAGNITLKRGVMACGEGAHFPVVRLADDAGNSAWMEDVTVTSCSSEEISFNYAKIEW